MAKCQGGLLLKIGILQIRPDSYVHLLRKHIQESYGLFGLWENEIQWKKIEKKKKKKFLLFRVCMGNPMDWAGFSIGIGPVSLPSPFFSKSPS